MKRIALDSDVLIEILRNNTQIAEAIKRLAQKDVSFLYSPVVLAELRAGMRPAETKATMALFDAMECISIGREIGERAGDYLNRYHRSHGVELADAIIAASAVVENADFLTLNRKHYPMKDLRIISLGKQMEK